MEFYVVLDKGACGNNFSPEKAYNGKKCGGSPVIMKETDYPNWISCYLYRVNKCKNAKTVPGYAVIGGHVFTQFDCSEDSEWEFLGSFDDEGKFTPSA